MKLLRTFLVLSLLFCPSAHIAIAQDEPSAVWQISRFDISVNGAPAERALNIRAKLSASNIGRGSGSTITLRINQKAEIKSAAVNDATTTFRAGDVRNDLQLVRVSLPSPVAPGANVTVSLEYRLPIAENSGLSALSPVGAQFLPLSNWFPVHNIAASLRGADAGPFKLSLTGVPGETAIASGKSSAGGFEQTLNAQPVFVTGSWDLRESAGVSGISAYLPKGASADERKQADEIIALAGGARDFFAGLLGAAPDVPIRLVAVKRGAGFSDAGLVLLDASAFQRSKVDASTAMLIVESIARLWIGGATPVRGEGRGVVREGLPRYLAGLFIEKHFGTETATAEFARERSAYSTISKRDAPLARTSQLDPTYFNSSANKGAMFWRLVDRALGREALLGILKTSLQAGAREPQGMTLAGVRSILTERGDANLKALVDQLLDQPTDMDLMVGLPQQKGAQWTAALRNTGSSDARVSVTGTTASGEKVTVQANIPSRNFGEAVFSTTSRISRVEVDPEKLYPQVDYANDVSPRQVQVGDPVVDASGKFVKQDFAGAEAGARAALSLSPKSQEARILLARSLLAQNKLDEAEREFRAALDEKLPTPATLAWANAGLGEISLRKGQGQEAARRFNDAVRADADYASTLAARLGRIKAEAAAHAAPATDASVTEFIAQLDRAIAGGRKAEIDLLILSGELPGFVRGIVGSQPELWQTKVVRTEPLDANLIAADVMLSTREFGKEQSGTAVLILQRTGGAWKLAGIELFEVR